MREPVREPQHIHEEPVSGVRPPEPLQYGGPAAVGEIQPYAFRDQVHWGPVWGGVFVTMAIFLLISRGPD